MSALRTAQAAFVKAAAPAMVDAQTQLNGIFGAADFSQDEATKAEQIVEQLGDVVAGGNLMAFNMMSALSSDSSDTLEAIEKEFRTAQQRVKSNLDLLPKGSATTALRNAATACWRWAKARPASSRSARRNWTPPITARPFWKKPASSMSASASACSSWSTACAARPTPRPGRRARRFRWRPSVMLALGAATLIGSVLFVWLYVGRNILRRIGNLQRSMQLLSSGDLESEIYRSSQNDEIAAMANSLQVFRESMIEGRALTADQDKDRIAKAERASRMEARIVEFETTVRSGARQPAGRRPIRCRPPRRACRRPPISPARW